MIATPVVVLLTMLLVNISKESLAVEFCLIIHILFKRIFRQVLALPEKLQVNNMVKIVLRLRSDLAELIEPNRRCNKATLWIWRLKFSQKWPEDKMQTPKSRKRPG
jgi:hypothetical protein